LEINETEYVNKVTKESIFSQLTKFHRFF